MQYHREPLFWRRTAWVLLLGTALTPFSILGLPSLPWSVRLAPILVAVCYVAIRLAYRDAGIDRRIRLGLCPKCGYDLQAQRAAKLPTCPECGLPIDESQPADEADI